MSYLTIFYILVHNILIKLLVIFLVYAFINTLLLSSYHMLLVYCIIVEIHQLCSTILLHNHVHILYNCKCEAVSIINLHFEMLVLYCSLKIDAFDPPLFVTSQ